MYRLIMLSGLNVLGMARSLALPCSGAQGRTVGDVCMQQRAWLVVAGCWGMLSQQLLEQGQALHPTGPSGMGRGQPEKGCQPKRWLLS